MTYCPTDWFGWLFLKVWDTKALCGAFTPGT